ncbi:MAG: HAD family hydrolase [Armatimonadetes bacterium]|nr:HAD family hydrolase [Armatimonadota bacterium]
MLDHIRGVIFDMDGVIYRGNQPLAGAGETLAFLAEARIPYVMVTNNSSQTAAQYEAKLRGMGFAVPAERVITSAAATARYLKRLAPKGGRVYLLGEAGLRAEVERAGFTLADRSVDFVVVGIDRGLTYDKLRIAVRALLAGARFVATNPDLLLPMEDGFDPGNGVVLAALSAATGIQPTVIGKPEPPLIELALEVLGRDASETAIVGDQLRTDILAGRRVGLFTIMVLTGSSHVEEITALGISPDLVVEDLPALIAAWRAAR